MTASASGVPSAAVRVAGVGEILYNAGAVIDDDRYP
jgi:hypothetical protein